MGVGVTDTCMARYTLQSVRSLAVKKDAWPGFMPRSTYLLGPKHIGPTSQRRVTLRPPCSV